MIMPLLVQALFGIISPLNKQALYLCPALLFTASKLLCAGAILFVFEWVRTRTLPRAPRGQWVYYVQIIATSMIGAHIFKYWGLQYITTTKMALLFNSSPFFVALISYMRFGSRITKTQIVGLTISFCGLVPMLITTSLAEQSIGEFFIVSWPELAILFASFLHAFGMTSKRIVLQQSGYWPLSLNALCLLGGGSITAVFAYTHGTPVAAANIPMISMYVVVTTVVSKVVCSSLYMYLMKFYSPTFLAFMDYWYVLFVAWWGWFLWGELITYHFVIAAAIVFCGQYLFYKDELMRTI